jgi:hypothetical protein
MSAQAEYLGIGLVEERRRTGLTVDIAFVALLMLGFSLLDSPAKVSIGMFTGSGILTLVYIGVCLLVWLINPVLLRPMVATFAAFILLLGWGILQMIWCSVEFFGLQQLAIEPMFLCAALVATRAGYQSEIRIPLQRLVTTATIIVCVGYLATAIISGFQSDLIFGPRPLAIFAVVLIPWFLSRARYGEKKCYLFIGMLLACVLISLSRTAFFACLALFPVSYAMGMSRKRLIRMFSLTILAIVIGYVVIDQVPAFRKRFIGGDQAFQVGGIRMNTMGRTRIWQATWDSFLRHPIAGQGAGSSRYYLAAHRFVPHPHNDYLRVLHDYGVIGFALFLAGLWLVLRKLWRNWRRADQMRSSDRVLHAAAFGAVIGYMIMMTTDNPLIYVYIQGPLALYIGASIGASERERQVWSWLPEWQR